MRPDRGVGRRRASHKLTSPFPFTDYAVVVIGFVFLLSGGTWIFQGRKHYHGPTDLGGLLELARVEVNSGEVSRPSSTRRSSSRPGTRTATRVGGEPVFADKNGEIKQV